MGINKKLFIVFFFSSLVCAPYLSFSLNWEEGPGYRSAPVQYDASAKIGFTKMRPEETGVSFTNILLPEYEVENQNLTIGSGVALGDINGDGLCDIFFCNLNGACKLYKNLGNWKFEDITANSGIVISNQLARGAVFSDVDGDGDLDLILTFNSQGARMYFNDGNGHFTLDNKTEFSTKRGGTSIALGDIDGDGDLDLYVENYGENTILRGGGNFSVRMVRGKPVVAGRYAARLKIIDGKLVELGEVDDFYLNDGSGRFIPVSWMDGRFLDEDEKPLDRLLWDYGLSVQIRDINGDGIPDIYVANDFHTPDRIWINLGNGKFRLIPKLAIRKLSYASMGIDFSDIDRNGWLDFFDLEMMSREHETFLREMSGVDPVFPEIGRIDDRPLVPRNTLFWNRGDGTYAEIAWFAGVAASDWSWSPIFLDVDLDGYEDILIVNGHYRDVNDKDMVVTTRTVNALLTLQESKMRILQYPPLTTPNVVFRNKGDLTFEDKSHEWGFDALETSHGMALADLDNDGDLDVVINCLNAPALIYRNDCPKPRVAVRLKGNPPNTHGINSKIKVKDGGIEQVKEVLSGSRYLSSDDTIVTFAAGNSKELKIAVNWRSGKTSIITNAMPDRIYEIYESAAVQSASSNQINDIKTVFEDVSDAINHTHHEEQFDDFVLQPLLPWRLSQNGPSVCWYDVDNDGNEDLLIGSGRNGKLAYYRNKGSGKFEIIDDQSLCGQSEDDQSALVAYRAENGNTIILVGLMNYETKKYPGKTIMCYEYDGNKIELKQQIILSNSSLGPIAVADIDGDELPDLFIGGQFIPARYPEPASSAIYKRKNNQFVYDVENSKKLEKVGLVNAAVWSDINSDGYPDLILACEWGQIRLFINNNGVLTDKTTEYGLDKFKGWWKSVATGDFNNDGLPDLVAGNWGLNSPYKATTEHPARLYYGDFNDSGSVDLVEAVDDLSKNKIAPFRGLDEMAVGLPFLRGKFSKHKDYAKASIADILGDKLKTANVAIANELSSMMFINHGNKFDPIKLPSQAQWTPVFGICVADFNCDGNQDIFLAQNFFALRLGMPRIDAGRGLILNGDGKGGLTVFEGKYSGIKVYGEQRGAATCDFDKDGRIDIAVSQNGAQTKLYKNMGKTSGIRIKLIGSSKNPDAIGATFRFVGELPGPLYEVQCGSGYRSQDGFVKVLKKTTTKLQVNWGKTTHVVYDVPEEAKEIIVDIKGNLKVVK
ncbi:MAG: VCBS repeat-containing protein [Verrucomicrobiia bacterium]